MNPLKNLLSKIYMEAEVSVQSEIPWYVTDSGRICIDVDEFVKRDCWQQQLNDFKTLQEVMQNERLTNPE